jgi:hypothetical protein
MAVVVTMAVVKFPAMKRPARTAVVRKTEPVLKAKEHKPPLKRHTPSRPNNPRITH